MPAGFADVEHGPYTVRLRVHGYGEPDPPEAYTRFEVVVAAFELALGDRTVLGRDLDRTLYDTLGGSLPASGATQKLALVSNVFKTSNNEMTTNALFTQYQALWGSGPQIPVFATIKVKDSGGNAVVAPGALGDLAVAWTWIDVVEDTSGHHPKAKAFLDQALDFDKDLTDPVGDNCHVDRGGKRGPDGDPVFPPQGGCAPTDSVAAGTFPFKVETWVERPAIAISRPWPSGAMAGKTGVLFEPSRMAGDAWKVRVCLLRDIGEEGPADDAPQAETGTFETWREVHVVKYLKKTSSIGDVNIGTFQAYYQKAVVDMKDHSGGSQSMVQADFNTRFAAAVAGQSDVIKASINPSVNQYTVGSYGVHFRSWSAWKNALQAARHYTAPQLATYLAGPGRKLRTANLYNANLKNWAQSILEATCAGYVHHDPGVNVLQFEGLHNLQAHLTTILLGWAPSFSTTGRTKCAFILCSRPGNFAHGHHTVEQVLTHEIGHHMFLPHAPFSSIAPTPPPGAQAQRHDATYRNCTMSYDYTAEQKFCGLCILRMRGWSADWLLPQPADNARP